MELTSEPGKADVIILYLLSLGKALLIDKRRSDTSGAMVDVLPQKELLLEGNSLDLPLTPEIVNSIERRQIMPTDPVVVQSYFDQLVSSLESKLSVIRPGFGPTRLLAMGPHFGPVRELADSELYQGILQDLKANGEGAAAKATEKKHQELLVQEMASLERYDPKRVEALRRDFFAQKHFRPYRV